MNKNYLFTLQMLIIFIYGTTILVYLQKHYMQQIILIDIWNFGIYPERYIIFKFVSFF